MSDPAMMRKEEKPVTRADIMIDLNTCVVKCWFIICPNPQDKEINAILPTDIQREAVGGNTQKLQEMKKKGRKERGNLRSYFFGEAVQRAMNAL